MGDDAGVLARVLPDRIRESYLLKFALATGVVLIAVGAVGYGVMNLVVFAYVCYYAYGVFGHIPVDILTTTHLSVGCVVASLLTIGTVSIGATTTLSPTVLAALAALICLCGFAGVLLLMSSPTRVVARRVVELSRGTLRGVV